MKKLFLLAVAALTVCGVACTPEKGGGSEEPQGPFSIYYASLTHNSVAITVEPADATATYYFDIRPKTAVDEFASIDEFAKTIIAELQALAAQYGLTLADLLSTGMDGYNFKGLNPETDYYAFAFGVSADGALTSKVVLKPFKTLEASGEDEGGATVGSGNKSLNNFTYGYFENCGDYYESGATNWYIDLYDDNSDDLLVIEVQTSTSATTFTGTYNLGSSLAAGTAVAGFLDESDDIYGTFCGVMDSEGDILEYQLCKTGTVTISQSGDNYTITLDSVDPNGYTIKSVYTGVLEEWDSSSESGGDITPATLRSLDKNTRRFKNAGKFQKSQTVSLTPKKSVVR